LYVPTKIFLCAGVGKHKENLASFEMALRNAGLAALNLVTVSSILPPNCKLISKREAQKYVKPGHIVHCVLSRNSTNEPHRLVAASIGIAIPSDKNQYGYLSEHHCYGIIGEKAGEYAEDLAAEMLATTLGVDFDPDKSYDERKEIWKISGKIVRTMNITKSAIGDKRGLWTTVIAAVVLLP
jgi:arginine decarboxylase